MQKECVICGSSFEAKHSTRQYCDKCQKNSGKARQYMERAVNISKRNAGEFEPKIAKKVCNQCGKEFHTYSGRNSCSDECALRYRIENAQCKVCGVKLYPLGIECRSGSGFCSDVCKEKNRWEVARYKGNIYPCENCGKEFIHKHNGSWYCSKECSEAHRTARLKAQIPPPKLKNITDICVICNSVFERHPNAIQYTCGKECGKAYQKLKIQKKQEESKKALKTENKISRNELVVKALSNKLTDSEIRNLHLCVQCRTSQAVCVMFQSKFRYHPEGVKIKAVNGTNIVLTCPQYS